MLAQAVVGEVHGAAVVVSVDLDVVIVDRVGRQQRDHAVGGQPAAVDEFLQHGLAFFKHLGGCFAHHFIGQDGREGTSQVPGLEERTPVDVFGDGGQIDVLEFAAADEFRLYRCACAVKRQLHLVGARVGQRQHRQRLLVGVLLADTFVILLDLGDVLLARFRRQQRLRHRDGARRIRYIHHRPFVVVGDLDGSVGSAGGGAADQQRNLQHAEVFIALHFLGHVGHFFQRWRD